MTLAQKVAAPIRLADRFYIDGAWIQPSSESVIDVIDSGIEELFFQVPKAMDADMMRTIEAARTAFDEGLQPRYRRPLAARLEPTGDVPTMTRMRAAVWLVRTTSNRLGRFVIDSRRQRRANRQRNLTLVRVRRGCGYSPGLRPSLPRIEGC